MNQGARMLAIVLIELIIASVAAWILYNGYNTIAAAKGWPPIAGWQAELIGVGMIAVLCGMIVLAVIVSGEKSVRSK